MLRSKNSYRSFLTWLSMVTLLPICVIGIINSWIDPFDAGTALSADRFESSRSIDSSRTLKANQLEAKSWDFVIAGTSRAELGIDPRASVFESLGEGYNVALPGSNLYEARRVVDRAMTSPKMSTVFLCLELVMFSEYRTQVDDFAQSGFARHSFESFLDRRFRNWFGAGTTKASWKTWRHSLTHDARRRLFQGFRSGPDDAGGAFALSEQIAAYYSNAAEAFGGFEYSQQRVDDLQEIMQNCVDEQVDLFLLIPPIHSMHVALIDANGLGDDFSRMKQDIVRIAGRIRAGTGGSNSLLEVWDFSGFRGVVREELPEHDHDGPMQYYYEISHFRPSVGESMISTVLDSNEPSQIPLVGTRIDESNLQSHLNQLESDGEAYRQEPKVIEFLKSFGR